MAKSCKACDDLRTDAPNLIVNGLTNTECASLKNNTGLNPSSGNDDCTDLDNMNDCLIGNMEQEIDAYDVCDWKDFMRKFIDNLWTVLKGIICAICGIWTNIKNLWSEINGLKDKISALCAMQASMMQPPTGPHGTLIHDSTSPNYGGTIATKNGNPVFIELPSGDVPPEYLPRVGVGLAYGKLQSTNCADGRCEIREWYAPYFYGVRINPDVELEWMDELWSVDKATAQSWGITDAWWNARSVVAMGWNSDYIALATALVGVRMSIENNRLVLRYYGQIGASDAELSGKRLDNPGDGGTRMFTSNC